ncbi:MAG: hypothetical protein Q9220_006695 [cf. Caloplaca sp. 1 TL-2023]
MQRVASLCEEQAPKRSDSIRPCDYFDLIGGTGTGGLIAIMFGRLRMTIAQCMEIFKEMTKVVFESDKMIGGLPYKSTLFKASKLEDAIRACVQEYEKQKTDTIHGPPGSPTRVGSMYSYKTTLPRRRSSLSNYNSRPGSGSMTSIGNPNATMHDPRKYRTKTVQEVELPFFFDPIHLRMNGQLSPVAPSGKQAEQLALLGWPSSQSKSAPQYSKTKEQFISTHRAKSSMKPS